MFDSHDLMLIVIVRCLSNVNFHDLMFIVIAVFET